MKVVLDKVVCSASLATQDFAALKNLADRSDPDFATAVYQAHSQRQELVKHQYNSPIPTAIMHGAVIDRTLRVDAQKFQELIDLMIEKAGDLDAANKVYAGLSENRSSEITSKIDVIIRLIQRYQNDGKDKFSLITREDIPELDLWLKKVFETFERQNPGILVDLPGGGAANMLRSVSSAAARHITAIIPPVNKTFAESFRGSEVNVLSSRDSAESKKLSEAGGLRSPMMNNFVIELNAENDISLRLGANSVDISATKGKTIFKGSKYISDAGTFTDSIELRRPGFYLDPGLSAEQKKSILMSLGAKNPVLIINGGAYIDATYVKDFLSDLALFEQGQALASEPSLVHLEFSGTVPQIKELCSKKYATRIKSLGLSDGEIPELYRQIFGEDPGTIKNDPIKAYDLVKRIAKELDLDRLHVHSGSHLKVDLILRRRSTDSNHKLDLQAEAISSYWKNYVIYSKFLCGRFEHHPDQFNPIFEDLSLKQMHILADSIAGAQEGSVYYQLMFNGIFIPENLDGYSLVVAPITKLPVAAKFPTGAGDTSCRAQTRGSNHDYFNFKLFSNTFN